MFVSSHRLYLPVYHALRDLPGLSPKALGWASSCGFELPKYTMQSLTSLGGGGDYTHYMSELYLLVGSAWIEWWNGGLE